MGRLNPPAMKAQTRTTLLLSGLSSLLALALACGEDAPTSPPVVAPESAETSETPTPAGDEEAAPGATDARSDEAAISRAEHAAKQLGKALKTRLVAAMGEGGPSQAVTVCADEAPGIARSVRESTGVEVGRFSTRLRNSEANGDAPAWVQTWLREHQDAALAELAPVREVVEGEAHFLAPIPTEAVCLNCHGAPEQISAEVRSTLAERYPEDHATGYSEGELRGVLWGAVALAEPTPGTTAAE